MMSIEQRIVDRSRQQWFRYSRDEIQELKLRIACSLFEGGPDGVEHGMTRITDLLEAYTPEQRQAVSRVMLGLKYAKGESHTFILAVRTDASDASTAFVDHLGRRYKDWDDFMAHNRLPKCYLVFPRNGIYLEGEDGEYVLDGAWLNTGFNLAECVDYVAAACGVLAGVALLASIFCPLMAPILFTGGATLVAVASSVWGGARCGQGLHDRKTHGESLADKEAALLWAGLAAAVVGGLAAVGTSVTSGFLQFADEIALGVRAQMGMRILRTTAAVLAPAAGLGGVIAVAKVGRRRLSPASEAAMIGLNVFMAHNILLSMDQAHQLRMVAAGIGPAETAGDVVSVECATTAAVEFLRRQPGVNLDERELPLVFAEALSGFESALSDAAAAALLRNVLRRCQEASSSSGAEQSDSVIESADEAEDDAFLTDGEEWSTIS